jgi:hypothetical protein
MGFIDDAPAAHDLNPASAKLLYERDQLAERADEDQNLRLARLEAAGALVAERDDLTIVFANLLTDVGRATEARSVLLGREFQPWEGGEGMALNAWDRPLDYSPTQWTNVDLTRVRPGP